jgi:hypothetical protein
MGKAEIVIDFTPLHGPEVKIKSLQMENQVVWDILKTSPTAN